MGAILRAGASGRDPILAPSCPRRSQRAPAAATPAVRPALPPWPAMLQDHECRARRSPRKRCRSSSAARRRALALDAQARNCRPVPALTREGRAISCDPARRQHRAPRRCPSVASRLSDAQHVARRRAPAAMRRGHAGATIELQLGDARARVAPQPGRRGRSRRACRWRVRS